MSKPKCHRCGGPAESYPGGTYRECADCTAWYSETVAQCQFENRARNAAMEMLEQLRQWVPKTIAGESKCHCGALSRMFPDSPAVTCNTCDTLTLIAKIEEEKS